MISDIDGTLVRPDKSLGAPVVDAFARLREAGIAISLISARPLRGMLEAARTLCVEGPLAAYNGGTVAQPDGTVISAERLSEAAARRALALLDQDGITVWVFADDVWHTRSTDTPHTASERITAAQDPKIVGDFEALLDRVDKMVGVSDDEPRLAKLEETTAKALGSDAAVARSQTYYLDVTAPRADKGVGVTALARAYGVPLAETAVIGDGGNDIAMFEVAGFSVAMGNGDARVRAAADETTGSNAEDGVAQAIDRLILPRTGG